MELGPKMDLLGLAARRDRIVAFRHLRKEGKGRHDQAGESHPWRPVSRRGLARTASQPFGLVTRNSPRERVNRRLKTNALPRGGGRGDAVVVGEV